MRCNPSEGNLVADRVLIVDHRLRISWRHVQQEDVPHSKTENIGFRRTSPEAFTAENRHGFSAARASASRTGVTAHPASAGPARLHHPEAARPAAIVVPDNVLFEGVAGECLREAHFTSRATSSHSLGQGKRLDASY